MSVEDGPDLQPAPEQHSVRRIGGKSPEKGKKETDGQSATT